jgi:hypothetical protein
MVSATASVAAHPGDRVVILWGFDSIEGVVIDVYLTGLGARYVVEVPILGPEGEALEYTTVTVPESALVM